MRVVRESVGSERIEAFGILEALKDEQDSFHLFNVITLVMVDAKRQSVSLSPD